MSREGTRPAREDIGATRARRAYVSAQTRGTVAYERGRLWIENQDPASGKGVTIGWVRRYQAADGQLYAVLLSAYLFLTLLPLLLIYSSYVYSDPDALARRIEGRLELEGSTSRLFDTVLAGASGHKLSAALIAADRPLLLRARLRPGPAARARTLLGLRPAQAGRQDQILYLEVLGALALMTLLFVLQTKALRGDPSWIGWVLDVGWFFVLLGFFVWAPWLLLNKRVAARDIAPGAVFTMLGLVGMRIVSGLLLKHWLEWYSKTYGAIGIVMAIFFWLVIAATVLVLAAALSPALAHRRDLRRAGDTEPVVAR